jgi:hypothetical protein
MGKPGFPRRPVTHRATMRMREIVGRLAVQFVIALGGSLTAAVLTALNPPSIVVHLHPLQTESPVSWPLVLALAVVGGVAALSAVWGLVWLSQFAVYLRKRGRDEWRTVAYVSGNGIKFQLERNPEAMPEPLSGHGVIECEVRTLGERSMMEVNDWGSDGEWVYINRTPPECSHYDVRWFGSYGSRRTKRKHYELVRSRFDLSASDEGVSGGVVGK